METSRSDTFCFQYLEEGVLDSNTTQLQNLLFDSLEVTVRGQSYDDDDDDDEEDEDLDNVHDNDGDDDDVATPTMSSKATINVDDVDAITTAIDVDDDARRRPTTPTWTSLKKK